MVPDHLDYPNDFLSAYMQLVEDTESPRVYHLWSALAGISACVGRRAWLPFGSSTILPNIYVLLSGGPALRKSSAVNCVAGLLRKATGVRFAPDDTGGKRQGLIAYITSEDDTEKLQDIDNQLQGLMAITPETLGKIEIDLKEEQRNGKDLDRHFVFVAASEFTSFVGHGNTEFLEFLGKMYDGEPYKYRLKNKKDEMILEDPLITMIGATTPTNIQNSFPPSVIGQGFTSRVIFVYGAKKYRSIPEPKPFNETLKTFVQKRFSEVYYNLSGEFTQTSKARAYAHSVYEAKSELTDGRFTYYLARRHTHLLKVGMLLAAARMSLTIDYDDYVLADELLKATEQGMPDALGEYGMSPVAAAKQQILEFIQYSPEPVTSEMLFAFMHRDLKHHELSTCLNELTQAGRILQTRRQVDGKLCFIPVTPVKQDGTLELLELLQNAPSTEVKQ